LPSPYRPSSPLTGSKPSGSLSTTSCSVSESLSPPSLPESPPVEPPSSLSSSSADGGTTSCPFGTFQTPSIGSPSSPTMVSPFRESRKRGVLSNALYSSAYLAATSSVTHSPVTRSNCTPSVTTFTQAPSPLSPPR